MSSTLSLFQIRDHFQSRRVGRDVTANCDALPISVITQEHYQRRVCVASKIWGACWRGGVAPRWRQTTPPLTRQRSTLFIVFVSPCRPTSQRSQRCPSTRPDKPSPTSLFRASCADPCMLSLVLKQFFSEPEVSFALGCRSPRLSQMPAPHLLRGCCLHAGIFGAIVVSHPVPLLPVGRSSTHTHIHTHWERASLRGQGTAATRSFAVIVRGVGRSRGEWGGGK